VTKRRASRARGRADVLTKKSSHITVIVATQDASHSSGGDLVGQKIHPIGLRVGIIRDWECGGTPRNGPPHLEDLTIGPTLKEAVGRASRAWRLNGSAPVGGRRAITGARDHPRARPGIIIGEAGRDRCAQKELDEMTGKTGELTSRKSVGLN